MYLYIHTYIYVCAMRNSIIIVFISLVIQDLPPLLIDKTCRLTDVYPNANQADKYCFRFRAIATLRASLPTNKKNYEEKTTEHFFVLSLQTSSPLAGRASTDNELKSKAKSAQSSWLQVIRPSCTVRAWPPHFLPSPDAPGKRRNQPKNEPQA